MQVKKVLFLMLALMLPALVFVFLKRFGRNEFEVPVFHRKAAEWTLPGCEAASVPIRYLPPSAQSRIHVLTTQSPDALAPDLRRLAQHIDSSRYRVIRANRDSVRCALLMRESDSEVLLDTGGHVRGYYRLNSREETDRLILEMKILLKQF